jgi:hypothetical protein
LTNGGKLKYYSNLPWNFSLIKCWYCSKLLWYFYNIGPWNLLDTYHDIIQVKSSHNPSNSKGYLTAIRLCKQL